MKSNTEYDKESCFGEGFWNSMSISYMMYTNSPVQDLIQRLVGVFIALDSLHEVLHRLFGVAVCVVGATQLHLLQNQKRAG